MLTSIPAMASPEHQIARLVCGVDEGKDAIACRVDSVIVWITVNLDDVAWLVGITHARAQRFKGIWAAIANLKLSRNSACDTRAASLQPADLTLAGKTDPRGRTPRPFDHSLNGQPFQVVYRRRG